MVNVRQIAEMGSYVNLLEYNKIEGISSLNGLEKKRLYKIGLICLLRYDFIE